MNNSLYGKTVENLRKRKDVRLCNQPATFVTYASRPLFKGVMPIDDNLCAAFLMKEMIVLDRPVYIGQAVLDLSKLRMYRLQYVDLQRYRTLYPEGSIRILAGDTDSFFLEVKRVSLVDTLYPRMLADGLLDTSNYNPQHPIFSNRYASKVGLIKDESGGMIEYIEWVFLRPKCYSMKYRVRDGLDNAGEIGFSHRAKGIQRRVSLTHDQYLDIYNSYDPHALDENPPRTHTITQRHTVSRCHQLYTTETHKIALSVMDDKRIWIEPNKSLPYGYVEHTAHPP